MFALPLVLTLLLAQSSSAVLLTVRPSITTDSRDEKSQKSLDSSSTDHGVNFPSVKLLHETVRQMRNVDRNCIISPFSAGTALSLLYFGIRDETKREVTTLLGIANETLGEAAVAQYHREVTSQETHHLVSANAIFMGLNIPLKQEFIKAVKGHFAAAVEWVDFEKKMDIAVNKTNTFIANRTKNMIKDLLQPSSVSPDTSLLLVNVLYFQAAWEHEFDRLNTRDELFTLPNGQTKSTSMMNIQIFALYADDHDLKAQLLTLNFQDSNITMTFILPRKTEPRGLSQLERDLTDSSLAQATNHMTSTLVNIFLPKFKFSSELQLKSILRNMGLKLLFSNEADMHNLYYNRHVPKPVTVADMIQKAVIDVNEKGVEAAAATVMRLQPAMAMLQPPPEAVFRADSPFMFLIKHVPTGAVLFIGRVVDPSSGQ